VLVIDSLIGRWRASPDVDLLPTATIQALLREPLGAVQLDRQGVFADRQSWQKEASALSVVRAAFRPLATCTAATVRTGSSGALRVLTTPLISAVLYWAKPAWAVRGGRLRPGKKIRGMEPSAHSSSSAS